MGLAVSSGAMGRRRARAQAARMDLRMESGGEERMACTRWKKKKVGAGPYSAVGDGADEEKVGGLHTVG